MGQKVVIAAIAMETKVNITKRMECVVEVETLHTGGKRQCSQVFLPIPGMPHRDFIW